MTTENIAQAAQAAGVLASLGQSTKKRESELNAEDERLAQREKDILLGAATAVQVVRDEQAELREEQSQIAEIKARAAQLGGTAPVPAPAPATPQPQAPKPVVDEPTVVIPATPAEPEAPEATTPPPADKKPTPADFRNWKLLAWVLFVIGALIGLFIAGMWPADEWARTQNDFVGMIFTICWWHGWVLGLGGLFGSFGARWERQKQ